MLDAYVQDAAFCEEIAPIIESDAFLRLKRTQHHNDSVYNHTLRVAYTAYRIGKRWKADQRALLRGALFHDLYFHDWRDKEHLVNHGWTHPYIALENAREFFSPVSDHEANIISSHMWPLTFTNPPRSKEAIIVSLSDKLVASVEVLVMFWNFLLRTLRRALKPARRDGDGV
ncbi:MAG: HD domain-containing protein [Spirochaetales bacterium]|nr:HD domain-containing protein [Spirochaetales bacterium]